MDCVMELWWQRMGNYSIVPIKIVNDIRQRQSSPLFIIVYHVTKLRHKVHCLSLFIIYIYIYKYLIIFFNKFENVIYCKLRCHKYLSVWAWFRLTICVTHAQCVWLDKYAVGPIFWCRFAIWQWNLARISLSRSAYLR